MGPCATDIFFVKHNSLFVITSFLICYASQTQHYCSVQFIWICTVCLHFICGNIWLFLTYNLCTTTQNDEEIKTTFFFVFFQLLVEVKWAYRIYRLHWTCNMRAQRWSISVCRQFISSACYIRHFNIWIWIWTIHSPVFILFCRRFQ